MHYACLRNLVQEIEGKNCKIRGFASKMSFRKARAFSLVMTVFRFPDLLNISVIRILRHSTTFGNEMVIHEKDSTVDASFWQVMLTARYKFVLRSGFKASSPHIWRQIPGESIVFNIKSSNFIAFLGVHIYKLIRHSKSKSIYKSLCAELYHMAYTDDRKHH